MDDKEAKDSLAAIAEAKRTTAANSKAPPGYYALLGLAMGLFLVALPLDLMWSPLLLVVAILIVIGSITWYSRTVSTWAWASLRGHGAWIFWLMMVFQFVGFVIVVPTQRLDLALISAAVTFITWSGLGPLWDRAYRRQLEMS